MIISSYSQLKKYIIDNKLTPSESQILIGASICVFFCKDYDDTTDMLNDLDEYWNTYKNTIEKPLFIGVE